MTRGPGGARGVVRVEVVTFVPAPTRSAFDLELDVDVHAESLPRSGETAVTDHGRRRLRLGDEVTFTARHLGRTRVLTSRVTACEPPSRFVDEQVRGPFRSMRHVHRFDPVPRGTRMVDEFSFSLPGGVAGFLVARCVVAPYLRRLLVARGRHIAVSAASAHGGRTSR